jgi:hypothetical protein
MASINGRFVPATDDGDPRLSIPIINVSLSVRVHGKSALAARFQRTAALQ